MAILAADTYCDKSWLQSNYWDAALSTRQIGQKIGIGHKAILHQLHKNGISVRSSGDGHSLRDTNHCKLVPNAREWMDGELLGDGGIWAENSRSARFYYASKYLEYCQYVSDTLFSFGIGQRGRINKRHHKKLNCYSYSYQSRSYAELLPVRKRWYPNEKKIVPRDIELTPVVCRQWYIGDGTLQRARKRRSLFITLATCGFSISDVKWLVEQLKKLGLKVTRYPSSNVISISVYSTRAFLDYIGRCPVDCYQYKWA